ncbi:hypothetical protein PIROE2DRAFT_9457, partial [Piromyces sp. E2]
NNKRAIYLYSNYFNLDNRNSVEFYNSRIEKNLEFIYSDYNFDFFIENCYFSGTIKKKNKNSKSTFLYSTGFDSLTILNSIFENYNIKTNIPLIISNGLDLNIDNSTFINLNLEHGFLIKINENINYNYRKDKRSRGHVDIRNSLFKRKHCDIYIENSKFQDIIKGNPIPAISDLKFSNFTIENTEFSNLNLYGELFGEDSSYIFNNVKLNDINSNSKGLLSFNNKESIINNMEVNNIKLTGEDSSFIYLDHSEYHRNLYINNIEFKDCLSNGALFEFHGSNNEIKLENSSFQSVKSYQPLIYNKSKMSNFIINNLKFSNNTNYNKKIGGIIHLNNDLHVLIKNSTFISNETENGGVLYFGNEINNYDLNIEKREITINNNIFLENEAYNFGGAIYSELEKINLFNEKNNSIINNKAGVNGGGIYITKLDNNNSFNFTSSKVLNNTSYGVIEDYAAKPSYITLDTSIEKNKVSIYSGNYLPLTFSLYNANDKFMNDLTNYYSFLTLIITLEDKLNNDSTVHFRLTGNSVSMTRVINDYYNIKLKIPEIEINVNNECPNYFITIKDMNNIHYCERAKCRESCPIDETAECIAYKGIAYKNDANLNICKCLSGWKGYYCNEKIIGDYRHISLASIILVFYIYISQGFILGIKVLRKSKNNTYVADSTSLDFEAHGNEIKIVLNENINTNSKSESSNDNGSSNDSGNLSVSRKKSIMVENFNGSINFSRLNQDNIDCFKDIIRKSERHVHSELIEALFRGDDSQVYFKYRDIKNINLTREKFIGIYKRSSNLGKK